jgi:hypothetical protein
MSEPSQEARDLAAVETVMRVQNEHVFETYFSKCRCGARNVVPVEGWKPGWHFEHVAREVVAALDLDARDRAAKAEGWDEGWRRCSHWWHAGSVGESHTVDPRNPHRIEAGDA